MYIYNKKELLRLVPKMLGLLVIIIVILYLLITANRMSVRYFRLKTFSFNEEVKLQKRIAECDRLEPPRYGITLRNIQAYLPESFYKDKHFYGVYYNKELNECVYRGIDVFPSGDIRPTSTISFYLASPYSRECYVNPGSGSCLSVLRRSGGRRATSPIKRLCVGEPLSRLRIKTPVQVPAPRDECVAYGISLDNYHLVDSSAITLYRSDEYKRLDDIPNPISASPYAAMGRFSSYEQVYNVFAEKTKRYW